MQISHSMPIPLGWECFIFLKVIICHSKSSSILYSRINLQPLEKLLFAMLISWFFCLLLMSSLRNNKKTQANHFEMCSGKRETAKTIITCSYLFTNYSLFYCLNRQLYCWLCRHQRLEKIPDNIQLSSCKVCFPFYFGDEISYEKLASTCHSSFLLERI